MSKDRKVAVIAGASKGIGAGLVRGFLDRGYRVVANSRSIKPETSDESPNYQAAIVHLRGAAERDVRIVQAID